MKYEIIIAVLIIAILLTIYSEKDFIMEKVNDQLTKDFNISNLTITSQPFPNVPNETEKQHLSQLAVNVLQPVNDLLGKKISINSSFRSDAVNKAVGGVATSQHRLGYAADFHVNGMDLLTVYKLIAKSKIPYDQLIIEKNANGVDWIHISYNPKGGRKQLLLAKWNFTTKKMDYSTMTV